MGICHLKNAELEAKHQKYKGRVVLRGDIVKDNSGSYAVFTEQGSSASQMTAAKIMYIISRLPGCDGQAANAESAFTAVNSELEPQCQKYTGRVVFRGDVVKYDSGAYAAFTEQGSSASQKSWTLHPDFQDVQVKQQMQYPVFTQVKMEDVPSLKIPK